MRSGGEPFGPPYEIGTPSLTEKIVRLFKLRGFFAFETLEKLGRPNRRNKYTRHSAANYLGRYKSRRRKS